MITIKPNGIHPTRLGAQISTWLKEQGLVHDRDYSWRIDSETRELIIAFADPMVEQQIDVNIRLRWS